MKTTLDSMKKIQGGVCAPQGFLAAGLHAGIKKRKKDVALIYSETPALAAGVFTQSSTVAACVTLDREQLDRSKTFRAVFINSGNANACTGKRGMQDARQTVKTTAMALDIAESEVLVSSTGVIGQFMPMDNVKLGIFACAKHMNRKGGHDAAEGICTTDTFVKEYAVEIMLDGKPVRIGGIAKGSGMIAPNMATMLAFVTTDAAIPHGLLKKTLRSVSDLSFNRITVDGDTSTNDMAIVLANGAAGNTPLRENSEDYKIFYAAMKQVFIVLSKLIVKDGEGATKFVELTVKGAPSHQDAEIACRTVANSSLVKTAIHGEDANWGRILAAVGRSGIKFNPDKTEIYFGTLRILGKNYDISFSEEKAKKILQKKEIVITVDLHSGTHSATFWTCDLSREYVTINASYRS
ncbi:MAG TPA: bifunctional glutamate N-acetyltransferase/amino-acid acetyltransferase ArgJ [Bacteroidota bacterium]|nr:bifunctional glutamate N-acetyltransferase/amino-acid acetyltransferase ArgJ [Bacteroidota bacterium]